MAIPKARKRKKSAGGYLGKKKGRDEGKKKKKKKRKKTHRVMNNDAGLTELEKWEECCEVGLCFFRRYRVKRSGC